MSRPRAQARPDARADTRARRSPVLSRRLSNGLTVLLRPVRSAPIVSVWCWYAVGSADEAPGATGMAHWLEHMNFKGTPRFSKREMKNLIEKRGGYWNGYTWIDQTTYFETLPKDHLDLALELESERMGRSLISPAEFESERTVILSELRGGENDPETLLDREVTAAAFHQHGYRWPTVGWEADIRRITRKEMVGFYRANYVPSNAALVIVGDIDPAETMRKVRRLFGRLPKRERPARAGASEGPQKGERRVGIEGAGRTSYVHVVHRAPAVGEDEAPVLLLLDAVLGGAKGINLWSSDSEVRRSSPLYQRLVAPGLAAEARSFYIPTRDPFLHAISLTAGEGVSVRALEEALLALLDEAASRAPAARALRKAKNQLRATTVFQSDSVTELAHQIGYFHTIGNGAFFEGFLDRVERVTAGEVRDLAARIFRPANRTVGVYAARGEGKGRRR
ncbi:MAG: pitrilysin family protein [Candidatus Eisenbacteria bacterium]